MNNKFFVIVLTFAVFSYITSIVHTQYMEQVKSYFTKTKSPIYSYSEFISSGTSLPLLPIIVLINIFILTFVAALIYLLFLTVIVSRNCNAIVPPQSSKVMHGTTSKIMPENLSKIIPNNLSKIAPGDLSKFIPKGLLNFPTKMSGGKVKVVPLSEDNTTNELENKSIDKQLDDKQQSNKPSVDSFDIFSDYLKSMCKTDFIVNIFKWFIYVIFFQILYFTIFILLIKTNIINKKNLSSQSYVSSLIHYYISGFYISTSIIFFVIMSNVK